MLATIIGGAFLVTPTSAAWAQGAGDRGVSAAGASGPGATSQGAGPGSVSGGASSSVPGSSTGSGAAAAPTRSAHPSAGGAAAGPAPSAAELVTAKKRYTEGEKKYKAGDSVGALADFRAANDIKPTPQAERYLGLCEDALGHFVAALDWYDRFLVHVPEKLSGQGDEIRRRETEIRAMPGKVHIESTPAGAAVAIDGKPQPTPAPLDVELPPGAHTIAFRAVGHLPLEKSIDVDFAATQAVSGELPVEPPPPPVTPPPVAAEPLPVAPPAPPAERRSKVPAYVTGALAIAAAGVGTVFGALALKDKSDFDKNPTTQTADDGDTHSLVADMSFGVAITFAVTSIVLFTTKDEASPTASSTARAPRTAAATPSRPAPVTWTPKPWVGSHGGGAGLLLRF